MTKIEIVSKWLADKTLRADERTELFKHFMGEKGYVDRSKWRRPFDKVWRHLGGEVDVKKVAKKKERKSPTASFEAGSDAAVETYVRAFEHPPQNMEEALKYSNANQEEWKVEKWIWNYWGNTERRGSTSNIQVKLWFTRRIVDSERAIENLLEKYQSIQMPVFTPGGYDDGDESLFSVINMYDAHLDKVPLMATCGETSTMEKNIEIWMKGLNKLLDALAHYNLEKIYYPLGNDLFHVNNASGTTKRGTKMEYFCSQQDAYEEICDVALRSIKLVSDVAPVHVPFIKGNHDADAVHTLSFLAHKMFENSPYITVDKDRTQRKYVREGNCLVGFAHGDKEKSSINNMPLLMASENRGNGWWSGTKHSKFYLGDLHHQFEYKFLKSKDMPEVSVEFLRSCGTTDTWHNDFGYTGIPKTVYADVWDSEEGLCDRYERNL